MFLVGGEACFVGGVGGFLGRFRERIGFAGRSFDIGLGAVGVGWVVCLECEGDMARPMRLGRQLVRLYAFGAGDFDGTFGAVVVVPGPVAVAVVPSNTAAVVGAAPDPVLESFGG